MFLLMLFLASQVYGQTASFKTKYKISCVKQNGEWSSWSDPMKFEASVIIDDEQVVIKNGTYQFFYLHDYKGRIYGINQESNDPFKSDTYIATDITGDSLHIVIYKYNSGEQALAVILSKAEYVYFTKKPPKLEKK